MAVIGFTSNQITDMVAAFNQAAYFNYEVDVHVGDKIITPFKLDYLKSDCDYVQGYVDVVMVRLLMLASDYDNYVYPFRNNLFITLRKIPVGIVSETERVGDPIRSKKYRALIAKPEDPSMQAMPSYDGDQTLKDVEFQLIDIAADQLRFFPIGFIAADRTPSDVIKAVLGTYSKQLNMASDTAIVGVSMYAPDEPIPIKVLIVPHGTQLVDLAKYIQKHCGGVYKYGIGSYIHNQIWYVYPLYDPTRYEKSVRTMDILMIPPTQRRGQDKTYAVQEKKLFLISTSDASQVDRKDIDYQNLGNATQFALASKTFTGYGVVAGNNVTIDNSQTTAQFILDGRESGLQATKFSSNRTTDNVFYEMSKKTELQGQYLGLVWENGDPDLLYPGMPLRLLVPNGAEEQEFYGVLINKEAHTMLATPGVTGTRYLCNIAMTIFIVDKKVQLI